MPLPKPPAKRGSVLDPSAFDAQSAPKPSRRSLPKPAAVEDSSSALELQPPQQPVAAPPITPAIALPVPVEAKTPAPVAPAKPARAPRTRSAAAAAPAPVAKPRRARVSTGGPAKLFVLDTNVLMHDPMSLFRFEEHDVYLPMITLEELDGHKKGMSEVSRNVRQVSRELDALAASQGEAKDFDPGAGIALGRTGHREAGGKLFFQTTFVDFKLPDGLPQGKADNQILGVVQALRTQQPEREVVLVSKDINMRIKARALGLAAEDYLNDKTLEDADLLYTGVLQLPGDFW
ncbi:MAG: PhoH-like ATPase, partial [Pseudomonadota bacterium]|nr:PhoH-like ATPase [Pseudomonadota bacterium]